MIFMSFSISDVQQLRIMIKDTLASDVVATLQKNAEEVITSGDRVSYAESGPSSNESFGPPRGRL